MSKGKKKTLFHGTGSIDAHAIGEQYVEMGAYGKGVVLSALQQALENARDEGSKLFIVIMKQIANIFRLIDHGKGFGREQIDGFLSLHKSPKKGKKGFIGQRGSGRFFLFQFCERIVVYSRNKEFPGIISFELKREDLDELIEHGKIERPVTQVEQPEWWDLPDTGSVLELHGVDWSKVPKPGEIVARFAHLLSPSLAEMTRIGDRKLKAREIHGEPIRDSFEIPELGGMCTMDLYIPHRKFSREETLRLGAYNPILPFAECNRQIREQQPHLLSLIPRELSVSNLCGEIYIPLLNDFVGTDRHSLNNAFYNGSAAKAVAEFLHAKVGPRVRSAMEQKAEEDQANKRQKLIATVCDAFNQAYQLDPDELPRLLDGVPVPEDPEVIRDDWGQQDDDVPDFEISVNPRSLRIPPGDSHTFEITRTSGTSGKYEWDISQAGGRVTNRTGKRTTYTAGMSTGKFRLRVVDQHDKDKFAVIRITVDPELGLQISPSNAKIEAGTSNVFRAKYAERTSGRLGWSVKPLKGIKLSATEGLTVEVEVDDACPRGEHIITVTDLEDPDVSAECKFTVIDPPWQGGNFIKIQSRVYAISFVDETDRIRRVGDLIQRERNALLNDITSSGSATIDRLWVNQWHDAYKSMGQLKGAKEGSSAFLMLMHDVIDAHICGRFDDDDFPVSGFDPVLYHQEFDDVRREVLKALLASQEEDDKEKEA